MNQTWDDQYKQRWDDRYKQPEFAYGKEPNQFFKQWLPQFEAQSILMPAEGEGRNGVFAAELGWKVSAFDLSIEGKQKALQLAKERNVNLHYDVADFSDLTFENESFEAIGLIYAHFSAAKKTAYHQELKSLLKPNGIIILEAFSKSHLDYLAQNPKVGGPKEVDMLYSVDEIKADFPDFEILYLKEEEIELNEGIYHLGKGSVIRFVGRKNRI